MRVNILIASAVSGNIVLEGMPEGSEEKFMVHADTLWDANNPEPLLCPNNACYQLDKEKRICQFNQHCAKVECGPGTSGIFLFQPRPLLRSNFRKNVELVKNVLFRSFI